MRHRFLLFRAACLCILALECGGKPVPQSTPAESSPAADTVTGQPRPQSAETLAADPAATRTRVTIADSSATKGPEPDKSEEPSPAAKKAFPAANSARRLPRPFPHRLICDSSGTLLGYEVFSDSAGVTGRGYAGNVPVQVYLDGRARPVRIYVLDNSETPAYLEVVYNGGLLERLLAYDPAKPESVDAVTLATSSSHAITAGVTALARRVAEEIAGR